MLRETIVIHGLSWYSWRSLVTATVVSASNRSWAALFEKQRFAPPAFFTDAPGGNIWQCPVPETRDWNNRDESQPRYTESGRRRIRYRSASWRAIGESRRLIRKLCRAWSVDQAGISLFQQESRDSSSCYRAKRSRFHPFEIGLDTPQCTPGTKEISGIGGGNGRPVPSVPFAFASEIYSVQLSSWNWCVQLLHVLKSHVLAIRSWRERRTGEKRGNETRVVC